MVPADVNTLTTDGHVHQVSSRVPIETTRNVGEIGTVTAEDPENPGQYIQVLGRLTNVFETVPATRYVCNCNIAFDRVDSDLTADEFFTQGAAVNCPNC